jgi:hypothetical protein
MRRDHLIEILLTIAALPFAASFMVGNDYLHLSGVAVKATFWGGIILGGALVTAAVIVARRGKTEASSVGSMTVNDIGFNAALAGGVATLVAAFFKAPRVAVIACILAWIGIGIDYWWGPPRGFFWTQPSISLASTWGLKGEPLGWSQPLLGSYGIEPSNKPTNVTDISIVGGNVSKQEVKLDDAYFLSGIDGTRLDAKISWGGISYKVQEIRPIPAGAVLIMSASFGRPGVGLSQEDFLQKWAITIFVVVQNGITQRTEFDQEKMKSLLPKPPQPFPHVSPNK